VTALLLEPHHDDAVLFASWTVLRHRPHIVTCFASYVQEARGGPHDATRDRETEAALRHLNAPSWQKLPVRDDHPDSEMLEALLREIDADQEWTVVFAPAVELGGHDHHNLVGHLAEEVFGRERLQPYLTYVRGQGRSRSANEVPFEPHWPALKFRAMSAYSSQINLPDCRPWFAADDMLREWYE